LPLASLIRSRKVHVNNNHAQAAASFETLKVKDSPIKKLNFDVEDKENMPVTIGSTPAPESILEKKPVLEIQQQSKVEEPSAPKTLKELEKDEPLLQENPHRFVLFPLKYHEIVRVAHIRCSPLKLTLFAVEHVQARRSLILDC
jgi:hypothetical protein